MEAVAATADETLRGLARLCGQLRDRALLTPAQLHQAQESVSNVTEWDGARRCTVGAIVEKRKAAGRVRECHGDLHIRNILTTRQGVQLFDCVEFAPSLRWIDVMNDIAFVIMDLCFNGQEPLAARLLNGYLEKTGDYAGLAVLPYYMVHRALIRGEVALLRAIEQADDGLPFGETLAGGLAYLVLANRLTEARRRAAVMIMHGYPGSGKSWFARNAVAVLGAVQLRSDVERKRLLGLRSSERGRPTLYTPAVTEITYRRLVDLADMIGAAGWPVIVDAAFLQGWQRKLFSDLAVKSGVPFFILDMTASPMTLRRRLEARARQDIDASDADTQVLENQIANAEPLTQQEAAHRILVDMDRDMDTDAVADFCEPVRQAMSGKAWTPRERSSDHDCRQAQI
jgi:predicted kinase